MSRLDEWRHLLGRARDLPRTVSRELHTLHELAATMPVLDGRIGRLDAELTAAVVRLEAGLTAIAADDGGASAITDLAARTAEIERALAALSEAVGVARSEALATVGETLATLGAEAREHAWLLAAEAKEPMRAAAEQALRARLPEAGALADGVSVLVWSRQGVHALETLTVAARAGLDALTVPGEILVSDDASRDGSRERAETLAAGDARIRVLVHEHELGAARSRNVQLSQARFRHALVLDADDTLVPESVAALHAAATATGAILAYGSNLLVDGEGRTLGVAWAEPPSPSLPWASARGPLAMLDVEAVCALGGFDPGAHGVAGVALFLRLAALGRRVTFVPTLVGARRAPATGESRVHREHALRETYGAGAVAPAVTYHPATGVLAATATWPESIAPATPIIPAAARGPRILVVSSGGVRNHGDDAILRATLQRLARLRPGCVPVVVSDGDALPPLGRLGVWAGTTAELGCALDPSVLRAACDDAALAETLVARSAAASQPIDPALRDLGAYDVVLIAGGGNLADPWPDLVAWRTAVAVAARARGVPVVVSGQGIGPVSDDVLPMLALLVRSATAFAVRDAGSHALLVEHGLADARTAMVGDDALGLAVDVADARARLAARGLAAGTPLVGFQVRVAGYVGCSRATLLELARSVDTLAAARGATVLGVPMNEQPPQPESALQLELRAVLPRRRARWMLADAGDDAIAAAAAVKTCAALVTCSFHAALFALEAGIPTALVASTEYYARKADALRQAFGLPSPIAVAPDASAEHLGATLDALRTRPWTPAVSSAAVDAWLDAMLG